MSADKSDYFYQRPVWQKLIIYLFIFGAIYVLVYYFLLPNKSVVSTRINNILHKPTPTFVNPNSKNVVKIQNFVFEPGTVSVKVGESVAWLNEDGVSHTAVADDGSFETGLINIGASKTIVFNKVGTYKYHCSLHPKMYGTIIVK